MSIQFRSVAFYAAVAQHNFNGFSEPDPLPGLLPVLYMIKYHPAKSGCRVIHTAGDAVIGKFTFPGDMIDFFLGEVQLKFIAECPGQRNAAGGTGPQTAAGQHCAAVGNSERGVFCVNTHDFKDPVDGSGAFAAFVKCGRGDPDALVIENPAGAFGQFFYAAFGFKRNRSDDCRDFS